MNLPRRAIRHRLALSEQTHCARGAALEYGDRVANDYEALVEDRLPYACRGCLDEARGYALC